MNELLRRLLPYCAHHKGKYALGFFSVLLSNILMVEANFRVGAAVDYITSDEVAAAGVAWRLSIIALAVLVAVLALYYQRIFIIGTSRVIEFELRNDFFAHLTRLSPSFFDHSKTGDIISRATGDIDQVRTALGPGILYPLTALTIIPVTLWRMFSLSGTVATISLIPMLSLPLVVAVMANMTYRRSLKIQEHFSEFSGRIQESITGIHVIKSFVQERRELETLDEGNRKNARLNLALARVHAFFFPSLISLFILGVISILWTSSPYITDDPLLAKQSNLITKGQLLSLVLLYRQLFFPILRLGWVISALQRAAASIHRLQLIWGLEPDIGDSEKTDNALQKVRGEIEFRDLTFVYPETDEPVLRDFSLKIEAGKTLGIVGAVGSGKSTVTRLIERLYDPPPGTVFVDGRDVREFPIEILRRSIAMVFQETFLFSDTIQENICFGVEESDPEKALAISSRSAAIAAVDEDVARFPNRFETLLGERGVNLSGGQKQRVALARAVAADRPILVLDDAFASVDTHTEERILQGLREVMRGRTTILVSHRISTVQLADEIIVLDDGRIAEQGSHDELVRHGRLYHDTYKRQLLERAVAEEESP